jgi:tRNA-specific 2-thiouridylase
VAKGSPLYVIQINQQSQQVVVGAEADLYSKTLRANQLNWIAIDRLEEPMHVEVKIRHRHEPASATIEMTAPDGVTAAFDQPQRAITPGQAAVFYDGDLVLGGGWIV